MIIGYLVGMLISLTLISLISGFFLRLGLKLAKYDGARFSRQFWISAAAWITSFLVSYPIRSTRSPSDSGRSILDIIPLVVLFLVSWLLSNNYFTFGGVKKPAVAAAAVLFELLCLAAIVVLILVLFGGLLGSYK